MQELIAQGLTVIAIAPFDQEIADELERQKIQFIPIKMERNGMNPFADILFFLKICKILKKEKIDIIFSYTIKPIIYGSIAAKFSKIQKIYSMVTGTGYIFLDVNLKNKIVGLIAQKLFKISLFFNQLVFFQNNDNLNFFRNKKIISSRKPVAIINGSGVDCELFSPVEYPKKISFLMIARLLYDKGIREYVAAARMIKKIYPDVKCKLVGWIDTNPNSISEQELNEWIQEGSIEFLGKLSDVRPAIAESSVYVLPSYHEGIPRTVLEAMAMARAIITTNAPGCKETVIHNKNGLLVAVKEITGLFKAMEFFILSPEKIHAMGKESRKLAIEKYDVNKVNLSILKAMQLTK